MPTAVVIQHVPHEGPGWLGELLDEAAIRVDVRRMYDGAALPAVGEFDAVIVMGGPMSAHDDERVPWLRGVMRLLVDATAAGTPTLGICLGAQLLAVACGGGIEKGAAGPELGLMPLRLTDAAGSDALFRGLELEPQTVGWHWDHIARLPDAAVLLATSPAYANQAFRVGERSWGLLFHPEVTLPLVAQWAQDDVDGIRAAGLDATVIVGAVAEAERVLLETWTPVLERFVDLVAQPSTA